MKQMKQTNEEWLWSVGPGWHPIVRPLLDMAKKIEGAQVVQVKEKFGGLRFYVHTPASDAAAALMEAIDKAEALSNVTCEDCGAPGKHVSPRGWIRTLCPACEAKVPRK